MAFRHFSHDHNLVFYEQIEEKVKESAVLTHKEDVGEALNCEGCLQSIRGPAYVCETCEYDFCLHKSCFELPTELVHPFHLPDHPLTLFPRGIDKGFLICNECGDLCYGFLFQCKECNQFTLDAKCALLTDRFEGQRSRWRENKTEIYYSSHDHVLFYFNSEKKLEFKCKGCEMHIKGPSYICSRCVFEGEYFILHKFCAEMPRKIRHPYHPQHPLHAKVLDSTNPEESFQCRICYRAVGEIFYSCLELDCDFHLDFSCTIISRGVKSALKFDDLDLYHFQLNYNFKHGQTFLDFRTLYENIGFRCFVCKTPCRRSFYISFKHNKSYVHLECIPLPSSVVHECHFHPLTLTDSFVEDDTGEYYCDVCEKKRDPNYPVYYCKECSDSNPYIAHIECVMSKSDTGRIFTELAESEQQGDTTAQIEIKSHAHILVFHDGGRSEVMECYGCKWELEPWKPSFTCEICHFYFHGECGEFLRHPLHLRHPLTKFSYEQGDEKFICDICGNIYNPPGHECSECMFRIDRNCSAWPSDQCKDFLKWKERKAPIVHSSHPHELKLANWQGELESVRCRVCCSSMSGSLYCCIGCRFYAHETCIQNLPPEKQHPYHPQHLLLVGDVRDAEMRKFCFVCGFRIYSVCYFCEECQLFLHVQCSDYLTSSLEYESHEHRLFLFNAPEIVRLRREGMHCFECKRDVPDCFYGCLEFDFCIHLECIPIPRKVKQKECHADPLTLMDSMYEDDSGVYYCDECEKPRNPDHPVYYCEECKYIAHVGCIMDKGKNSLEILELGPSTDLQQDNEATQKGSAEHPVIAETAEEVGDLQLEIGEIKIN